MSRAPYQYLPQAVYDEDERRKKADAWAAQHRAALASQWRDLHAQDARDLLAQHGLDEMGMPLGSDPSIAPQDITTAASPADSFPSPSPAPAADVLQKVGDAAGLAPPSFDEVLQKAVLPGEGISDAAMTRTLTGEAPADRASDPPQLAPPSPGLGTMLRTPFGAAPSTLTPPYQRPTPPSTDEEGAERVSRGEAPITGIEDITGTGAARFAQNPSPLTALAGALDTGKAGQFIGSQLQTQPGAMFAPPEYEALHADALEILRRKPGLLPQFGRWLRGAATTDEPALIQLSDAALRGRPDQFAEAMTAARRIRPEVDGALDDFLRGVEGDVGGAGLGARAAGEVTGGGDALASAGQAADGRLRAPGRSTPLSPPAQRVADAYDRLTPSRVEQVREHTKMLLEGEFPPEQFPRLTPDFWDDVVREGEDLVGRSKMVVTQLAPEALHDFLTTGRLRSKFDALDEAGVVAAAKRSVPVDGGRQGEAFGEEQARHFVHGEAGGDRAIFGTTNYAPQRDANSFGRIYGSVTDGQGLPNERRPTGTVLLVMDPTTTRRVTSAHHHYAFANPFEDIHVDKTPQNLQTTLWEEMPGGRIDIGGGQRILDTPWAVGPAGEDALRFSTLVKTMAPEVRAMLEGASGPLDPRDVAAVLLRGSSRQDQPVKSAVNRARVKQGLAPLGPEDTTHSLTAARNVNRSETMILEPSLDDVTAIYLPGTDETLDAVGTAPKSRAGEQTSARKAAERVQAKILELTGRRVPIVEKLLEPGGSKLPPSELSPGRAEVVGRYTGRGLADIGGYAPVGGLAGVEQDENGNLSFDPTRAALGVAAGTIASDKRAQGAVKRFFHGTGSAFDRPDPATFKAHGTFGPGYYLTDHPLAAETFALARGETHDAADASLANLRRQLSEATDPALRRSLERDIARIEGATPPGGPNIRAVDVPDDLRLFDAHDVTDDDAAAVQSELARTLGLDPWEDRAKLSMMGVSRLGGDGARLWRNVRQALGGDAEAANDLFARAGFDGIAFDGSRYGLDAPDGAPIANEAVVIFPESMEKLRNAISGTPFGGFGPVGAAAGIEVGEDENGNPTVTGYDPALGAVAMVAGTLGTPAGRKQAREALRALEGPVAGVMGDLGGAPSAQASKPLRPERGAVGLVESGASFLKNLSPEERAAFNTFKKDASPAQPWIDRAQAVRYAGMLADVAGRGFDALTNLYHTAEQPALDLLAGEPKAAVARVRGIADAIPAAWVAAAEAFTTGQSAFHATRLDQAGQSARPFGSGLAGRALNVVADYMVAADDFTKTINGGGATMAEAVKTARREGRDIIDVLEHPTPAIIEKALGSGEYATYTESPGAIPKWLSDGARLPGAAGLVVSMAIPFMRVGANVATRGTRAFVAPVIGPLEAAWKAAKGDGEAARYALARTELAAGMGLLWWSLWANGTVKGNGPSDPQANAQWRGQGNMPNSIDIPGIGPTPLGRLGAPGAHAIILVNALDAALDRPVGPTEAASTLAAGGALPLRDRSTKEQKRDIVGGPTGQSATGLPPALEQFAYQWIAGAAEGMKDISYLRGVLDFFKKDAGHPLETATRMGTDLAGGAALNRVGQMTDPYQRETSREGGLSAVVDTVKSRTPGLRETLPIRQDELGKPVKNPRYGSITTGAGEQSNPVTQAALDAGVTVSAPPKEISVAGTAVPLTREEQRAYQRYSGEILERFVAKQTAEPRWATWDAKKRQAAIREIQKAAHEAASAKVQKDVGAAELKRRIKAARAIEPQPIR